MALTSTAARAGHDQAGLITLGQNPSRDRVRLRVLSLGAGVQSTTLALMAASDYGELTFDPMETTYFTSRESLVSRPGHGMPMWRDKLFAFLHRNAAPASDYFRIPCTRQVELGAPVEI